MKNYFAIIVCVALLIVASSCTTLYKAAVDERSVKTIASDTEIKANIVKKFVENDTIKALDIFTACYDSHVYLVGEYESEKQKNLVFEIAEKTEGVKTVTTYLLPKKKSDTCGTKDNISITANVKKNLIKDKNIWSTNIDVRTVQCNVILVGIVKSNEEIQKAIAHAKSVEGVRSVKSFLKPAD